MDVPAWVIPPGALAEWLRLAAVLEEAGAVPCRQSDAEAWWPTRQQLDGPAVRMAVAACWRCPALDACLTYAVAAGEREGIWGATLPEQRREMSRADAA
jgi:WhiB family redox-sensing transcriptional regulator